MRYFDTSFLVPLVLPEATSDPIARLFEGLLAEDLAVSHWTRVEFASMFARVVRMDKPDAVAAHDAGSRFDAMTEESFIVLLSDHVDFDRDREWFCRFETSFGTGEAPASCHGEQPLSGGNPLPRQGLISAGTKPGPSASAGIVLPASCQRAFHALSARRQLREACAGRHASGRAELTTRRTGSSNDIPLTDRPVKADNPNERRIEK